MLKPGDKEKEDQKEGRLVLSIYSVILWRKQRIEIEYLFDRAWSRPVQKGANLGIKCTKNHLAAVSALCI